MRKLIVSINITLDGYFAGPDCELDWHFKSWTKEMGDVLCVQLAKADTILLGRVTYGAMAKYWPAKIADPSCQEEDFAFANMMNSYAKIVFSKSIASTEWNNTRSITGDLKQGIKKLKKKNGKDIIVFGSGQLIDKLINLDLADEFHLWVHPVILGNGKSLFKNSIAKQQLELTGMHRFLSGVVLLQYQIVIKNKQKVQKAFSKANINFSPSDFQPCS